MVRVRIAPSPTGIPHIGNTRTALFNYLFAKHNKGEFILRIEDTDRARLVPESEEAILEILKWLELSWDGQVEKQSNRLEIYKEHASTLLKKDVAYEDEGAIRFKMPTTGTTEWVDAIGNKKVSFENKDQEDFVMIKSDGYPTYNFASVVDDHLMQITHVIRGQEFISSTPKHIQLYKTFNWDLPIFAHLPIILGSDHQKLSKRHGAKSALDYRDDGYLKEALINYMVLLGWSPGKDKEIMAMEEMISLFDLNDINSANPIFDPQKLLWMNGEYIRQLSVDELSLKLKVQSSKLSEMDDDMLDKFVQLAQTRMKTINEFYDLVKWVIEDVKIELTPQEKEIAKKLAEKLAGLSTWNEDSIFPVMKEVMTESSIKMSTLYRIFTGSERGLPLPKSLEVLGKEKSLQKITS